jgi:hypothetical protein
LNPLFLTLILLVNTLRFIGLDSAPPGFYVDESIGASQVICIQQTGSDLRSIQAPLFSRGLDTGYYTAPYLYGQVAWTSVFGHSRYAFRSFLALMTTLTVAMIYLWMGKRTNKRTALIAALLASISPWAFQFSRIAWDPPMAPFFLMLGLVFFDLETRWKNKLGAAAFALASYAYPPIRLQALAMLFITPGKAFQEKLKSFAWFCIFSLPLLWQTYIDPMFSARSKILVLWSDHPMNPFREAGVIGWMNAFFQNIGGLLSPEFLLISGDHNLRHSTRLSGMMSVPEWLILNLGLIIGILFWIRHRKAPMDRSSRFVFFAALLGLLPAALTWEGNPHALRSIGAWPFFVMLAAMTFEMISAKRKAFLTAILFLLAIFYSYRYFQNYFFDYPEMARSWFKNNEDRMSTAYERMTVDGMACSTLQEEIRKDTKHGSH